MKFQNKLQLKKKEVAVLNHWNLFFFSPLTSLSSRHQLVLRTFPHSFHKPTCILIPRTYVVIQFGEAKPTSWKIKAQTVSNKPESKNFEASISRFITTEIEKQEQAICILFWILQNTKRNKNFPEFLFCC